MRLGGDEYDLLCCLNMFGPLDKRRLYDKAVDIFHVCPDDFPNAVHKLKAYGLVKPMRRKTGYWLDLTEKALILLKYREVKTSVYLEQKRAEK